jgi:hypothetical protein
MNELSQQTDQLVLWLKTINGTLERLELDFGIVAVVIIALLMIIAFRRSKTQK